MADVPIAGEEGTVGVPEKHLSEDERREVGAHWSALIAFRNGESGAESRVAEFEGQVIGGVPLVTDLDQIEELATRGELDLEEFYEQG